MIIPSKKILARGCFDPRSVEDNLYEANALPSELADPAIFQFIPEEYLCGESTLLLFYFISLQANLYREITLSKHFLQSIEV